MFKVHQVITRQEWNQLIKPIDMINNTRSLFSVSVKRRHFLQGLYHYKKSTSPNVPLVAEIIPPGIQSTCSHAKK